MTLEGANALMQHWMAQDIHIVNLVMAIMTLGVSMHYTRDEIIAVLYRPRLILALLAGPMLVLPITAFYVIGAIQDQEETTAGMTVVALCPVFSAALYLAWLAKANAPATFWVILITTVAAILLMPMEVNLWMHINPGTRPMLSKMWFDPYVLAEAAVIYHIAPALLGTLLREKLGQQWSSRIGFFVAHGGFLATSSVLFYLISKASSVLIGMYYLDAIYSLLLMVLSACAAFGFAVITGISIRDARTALFLSSTRFTVISTLIIYKSWPLESGAIAVSIWWTFWQYSIAFIAAIGLRRLTYAEDHIG